METRVMRVTKVHLGQRDLLASHKVKELQETLESQGQMGRQVLLEPGASQE